MKLVRSGSSQDSVSTLGLAATGTVLGCFGEGRGRLCRRVRRVLLPAPGAGEFGSAFPTAAAATGHAVRTPSCPLLRTLNAAGDERGLRAEGSGVEVPACL